jgi:hypothetical protein
MRQATVATTPSGTHHWSETINVRTVELVVQILYSMKSAPNLARGFFGGVVCASDKT